MISNRAYPASRPIEGYPRAEWDSEGKPLNIAAAVCDALEWLAVIDLVAVSRGWLTPEQGGDLKQTKDDLARLSGSISAAEWKVMNAPLLSTSEDLR